MFMYIFVRFYKICVCQKKAVPLHSLLKNFGFCSPEFFNAQNEKRGNTLYIIYNANDTTTMGSVPDHFG